jgi:hypothetical protein
LIRHAGLPTPVLPLPVAVIEPAFRALLVPYVGASPLSPAGLFAASAAAIAMPAIAVGTDEEQSVTLLAETDSLQENRFAVSLRHASSQAGPRQRHALRGRLEPPLFGLPDEGCRTRNPAASNDRVPSLHASDDTILRSAGLMTMIGRMTAPAARMMSLFRREVQKTTFSDDR